MQRNIKALLICLVINPLTSWAQGFKVDGSTDVISIPENATWTVDASNTWLKDGLIRFKNDSSFQEYSRNAFVYRDFSGPAILKFNIRTDLTVNEPFILELRNTEIDRAQVLVIESDSIVWESDMIGDIYPFHQRYFQYRTLAFPLNLEPNKSYTILLGIEKKNRIISSLIELCSLDYWEQRKSNLHLIYGLFFGLFLMVLIVTLVLFTIIHQRLYLYYGLYVICMMLLLGSFHGFNYQFLFPNKPGLQQYFMLLVQYLSLIFGNLYAFQFLGNENHSALVRKIRYVFVLVYVFGLANTIIHLNVSDTLEKIFNLTFIVVEIFNTVILAGLSIFYIIKYRSGAATVFLISFIFVGLAVFYTNLSFVRDEMSYIPIGHSLLIALAIEMIILTLFMIIQFKQIENEKILAENKLVTERIKNQHAFINGQEIEKRNTAIQLHDEIGSSLLAIKHQLETIPNTANLQDQITSLARQVRTMSRGLLPATLEELGLVAAVKELISSNGTIKFHFNEVDPVQDLNKSKSIQIYRIIQELVKNSYQHADAKNIYIQFFTEDDCLEIHYEDDGKGFDKGTLVKGIGMKSMRERASMIDAVISFESQPGEGMTAMIRVKQ